MAFSPRNPSGGFTYLAALIIIIIMGIMLGAVGQIWSTIMKREREEELLFRGKQYVDAIARWNKPRPGQHVATPLKDLKDLLKDPRSLANVRYLRRLYTDPLTGKEWKVISDPVKGVVGVVSTSDVTPLRQSKIGEMFSIRQDEAYLTNMFTSFEGKTKYSEWQFVYGTALTPIKTDPMKTTPAPWQQPTQPATQQPAVKPAEPDPYIWNRRNSSVQ